AGQEYIRCQNQKPGGHHTHDLRRAQEESVAQLNQPPKTSDSIRNHDAVPATAGADFVPRYSWSELGVLSLVNFLNYIDRQVLPAVAPMMLEDPELRLTHSELGYIEASLLLSFTVLAPLFGYLG